MTPDDIRLMDAIWSAYAQLARKHGIEPLYRYCEHHRILSGADRCELCLAPTKPVPYAKLSTPAAAPSSDLDPGAA